jgi:hypothetical protein
MSERDDAIVERLLGTVQDLASRVTRAEQDLASTRLDLAEAHAAYGIELRRQLLINERQQRVNAELARALGGRLVETPPARKKPKPKLAVVVDNTPPPDGSAQR